MKLRWAGAAVLGVASLVGCSGVSEDDLVAPATVVDTTVVPSTTAAPTTEPTTTAAPTTETAPTEPPTTEPTTTATTEATTTEPPTTEPTTTTTSDSGEEALEELPMTGPDEAMLFIAIGCALLVGGRSMIDAVNAVGRRIRPAVVDRRPMPPR